MIEQQAGVPPAALELLTAWTEGGEDPAFFWAAVQRVMADNTAAADPGRALAELVLGLTSLSGILLQHLADAAGASPEAVLGELAAVYRPAG